MARSLRINYPDALYHVTCRGNEQKSNSLSVLWLQSSQSRPSGFEAVDADATEDRRSGKTGGAIA